MSERIAVIGGGVIGRSTAIRLAERGLDVTLISGQHAMQTTSATAAAYWAPYWIGDYDRDWAKSTLTELHRLTSVKGAAIAVQPAEEWLDETGARELDNDVDQTYWWRNLPMVDWSRGSVPYPRSMALPGSGERIEFVERVTFRTPVARMPDYLAYLLERFLLMPGARYEERWAESLDSELQAFDTVVNCTGWQAVHMVPEELQGPDPMRLLAGHVLAVPVLANSELTEQPLISLHHGPFKYVSLYIVPRHGSQRDIICGGTAILTDPPPLKDPLQGGDAKICEDILQRCASFEPKLSGCEPNAKLLGLRPVRKSVRIERDAARPRLIHCYGHGGSGLTLSWGSADHVVRLVTGAV